ncbi:hypothetical protein M23134_02876 [Microscilla marina ATCC 23134]|uniref:Uncharacterized protein n=1 Tax=Microscilla marina ATCC 23134 TaxID=313606 RepID=A1ZPX4_MICM2|nr:hypothetical protein M23134_02876 [Microscilla marina ATCC 23134]
MCVVWVEKKPKVGKHFLNNKLSVKHHPFDKASYPKQRMALPKLNN